MDEKETLQYKVKTLQDSLVYVQEEKGSIKRNHSQSTSDEKENKALKEDLITVGESEWLPCAGVPKLNETIWMSKDNEPREIKIQKRGSEKIFQGLDIKSKTVYDFEIGTEDTSHMWSYTRPICKKSPNNSEIMKAPASTPVGIGKFTNALGKRSNSKK